jgi:hypothetical protein
MSIYAAQRLKARVTALYSAQGGAFASAAVERFDLTYEGIAGDRHGGLTRTTGGREPWHKKGTQIRNERQLSMVCLKELAQAAALMGVDEIKPEWIGANMVLEGIASLSTLPPRSLLLFESGATIRIDGQNAPCRYAGDSIAEHYPDHDPKALALGFPRAAKGRRGLVGWVERPGTIAAGDAFTLQVPEQWIWQAGAGGLN